MGLANLGQTGSSGENTAYFKDDLEIGIGNLRLDVVLISKAGLRETALEIFCRCRMRLMTI